MAEAATATDLVRTEAAKVMQAVSRGMATRRAKLPKDKGAKARF